MKIGAAEVEAAVAACGAGATHLVADSRAVYERLSRLAPVLAVTRNGAAALETRGAYARPGFDGTSLGGSVQLRMRAPAWSHVFAFGPAGGRALRRLAVFGPDGAAVHEATVQDPAVAEAFDAAFADLVSPDQSPAVAIRPLPAGSAGDRLEELRFADAARAWPVVPASLGTLLEGAAREAVPLAVTVANAGTRQRWEGSMRTARQVGQWVTVLDDGARLQVRGDRIVHAWVARRYTMPGTLTTLELFDATGEPAVVVSPAGDTDDPRWVALVGRLPRRA